MYPFNEQGGREVLIKSCIYICIDNNCFGACVGLFPETFCIRQKKNTTFRSIYYKTSVK